MKKIQQGFTLIELLIVIAILGTLAVVVLVAINPVQQLARTRDSGRISGVTQIGHALEAYATSNSGAYPPTAGCAPTGGGTATWIQCLVNSSELSSVPGEIRNSVTTPVCTTNVVNATWCYNTATTGGAMRAIVFSKLEGNANISRCPANSDGYAVYSTPDSRGGIVCVATGGAPAVPAAGATFGTCPGTTPCLNRFLP